MGGGEKPITTANERNPPDVKEKIANLSLSVESVARLGLHITEVNFKIWSSYTRGRLRVALPCVQSSLLTKRLTVKSLNSTGFWNLELRMQSVVDVTTFYQSSRKLVEQTAGRQITY